MRYRTERAAIALKTILFLASILAVFVVAGVWQSRVAASSTGNDDLERARAAQVALLRSRRDDTLHASTAIAANGGFVAYVSRALGEPAAGAAVDTVSLRDQLAERRVGSGLDAIAVLLPSGRLVASVGKDLPDVVEFSRDDRFSAAMASASSTSGYLVVGPESFQVAFSPMTQGGSVIAVLLGARRLDADLARDFAASSGADYALVVPVDGAGLQVAASSLDANGARALSAALTSKERAPFGKQPINPWQSITVPGLDASMRVQPIADATPGTALLTIEAKRGKAPAPSIFVPLAGALFGVLVLIALAGAWVWRCWIEPTIALAKVAEHSAVGDYAIAFAPRGAEAIRRIGNALNRTQTQLHRQRPLPGSPRRRATDKL